MKGMFISMTYVLDRWVDGTEPTLGSYFRLKCKMMEKASSHLTEQNSKLLWVKRYLPLLTGQKGNENESAKKQYVNASVLGVQINVSR